VTIQRIDHVGVVVDDLAAATAFFLELGLELEGEASLETRGAELVGEVVRYGDSYRLCYVRGPEGIIVELAEAIG
jgi:catechol 2,3-dioxygenase-like lactoylglutathione lyase family enzyme